MVNEFLQAMKKWYPEKPDIFKKRVYNQMGLDTSTNHDHRGLIEAFLSTQWCVYPSSAALKVTLGRIAAETFSTSGW
ncbi:MAG: Unknown protein [uncultured Thiotrichaceae bacterium]|uniref:Uncharacterized protein n=1 Tax=uncultured Thiotrichaceae bacterium TaxID=298394 RepID=A0A6S6S5C7_9GAMM|nr:MAG: Unknown protein [uncultured Thiotrichaceae bacterium]